MLIAVAAEATVATWVKTQAQAAVGVVAAFAGDPRALDAYRRHIETDLLIKNSIA
jgi:hypothetical protein